MTELDENRATSPRRRFWRRTGWAVGIFVVVVSLGGVLIRFFSSRGLSGSIAAIEKEEGYWKLADLIEHRPAVPDDENSALFVADIHEALGKGWLLNSSPGYAATGPQRLGNLQTRLGNIPPAQQLTPLEAEQLRIDLAALEPTLSNAHKLADLPRGRTGVTAQKLLAVDIDYVSKSRGVARLLHLDAAARAQFGDIDGALDNVRGILNTGRSFGDEPLMISQLVRMAIEAVSLSTLERVLAQGEPSDAALAKLDALLADEAAAPMLVTGLKGERAYSYESCEQMLAGRMPGIAPSATSWLIGYSPAALFIRHSQSVMLEALTRGIKIAQMPLRDQPKQWVAWAARYDSKNQPVVERYMGMLAYMSIPAVKSYSDAYLRSRANLNTARLMIALERYRRATGSWPDSPSKLVPRYLSELPVDPFSPEPIRFVRSDDGLTVYSVGPDGIDDGGKLDSRFRQTAGFDWGFRLFDPGQRRQLGPELPDNVFESSSDEDTMLEQLKQ